MKDEGCKDERKAAQVEPFISNSDAFIIHPSVFILAFGVL